jgi:hypothetical protein
VATDASRQPDVLLVPSGVRSVMVGSGVVGEPVSPRPPGAPVVVLGHPAAAAEVGQEGAQPGADDVGIVAAA